MRKVLPYHSEECIELQRQIYIAQDDFERRYPQFCRFCGGSGATFIPGRRYYRDGSGEPDLWDTCSGCSEQLRCALCGVEAPEDAFSDGDAILPCGHAVMPSEIYPEFDYCACYLDDPDYEEWQ